MAATRTKLMLAFVLVAAMWDGGDMASSCPNIAVSLTPCMDFILKISKDPSARCCKEFKSLVEEKPDCVCEGIQMEKTTKKNQVSKLPKGCSIDLPTNGSCAGLASAPSGSRASGPSSSTDANSASAPSPGGEKSDGNSIKLPFSVLFSALFIASYASIVRVV